MYNTPYFNGYNPQTNIERINNQIAELEKMKSQMQQPAQPTAINQTFQLAPSSRDIIKYANSMEEVQKDMVVGDTPYFSRDMSVVWIKNTKGEIKTYELSEVILKDERDIKIEMLQAQITEMKGMMQNARADDEYVDEPVESKKSTDVSILRTSSKKSKQS